MTTRGPLPQNFADELTSTPYKHVRALAKGGMGEVHVVEHRELGGEVVLKVIRAHLLEQEEHLTLRLRAEGRALRAVRHPNLVDVVDFGFTGAGRAYLVTELLHGETLKDALKARKVLPFPEVKELLRQLLSGLIAAHAQHVVHRDIKPDNLFWCRPGPDGKRPLKILDFGIAKLLTEEAKARVGKVAETKTGMVVGTPLYLSPEQALAQDIDERADLYAVACVAFHLAVGRPPFVATPGPNAQLELLQAHLTEAPPTPSTLAKVPTEFDAWVHTGMAKQASDRFASARVMLDALEKLEPEAAPAPQPVREAVAQANEPRRAKHGTIPMSAAGLQSPLTPPLGPAAGPALRSSGADLETMIGPTPLSPAAAIARPAAPIALSPVQPDAHLQHRRDLAAAVAPLSAVAPPAPLALPVPAAETSKSLAPVFAIASALLIVVVVVFYFLGTRL